MQRITSTCVLLLSGLLCQPSTGAEGKSLADVRGAIVSIRWNVGAPPGGADPFMSLTATGDANSPGQLTINAEVKHGNAEQDSTEVFGPVVEQRVNENGLLMVSKGLRYSKSTNRATGFASGQRVISILNAEARKNESLVVINPDGSEHKPTILAWDPATGLTVLEVKSEAANNSATGLSLAEKIVEWGDSVRVAHEFRTGNPALITGIVSTTPEYDGAVRAATFDIDGHFTGNTTGAPVLNGENEVVGIVNGQRSSSGDAGPGIAVQADKIRGLLAFVDAGSKGAMPKPMIGISLSLTIKGAEVEKVMEDSPASSAGLKTGDLIISIDGQKATRPEDVIAFVDQHMPGDEVQVQIEREGDLQDLTMQLKALKTPEETSSQSYSQTIVWNLGGDNAIGKLPPGVSVEQRKQIEDVLAKLQAKGPSPNAAPADSDNSEGATKRVYISAIPPDVSQQVAELRKDIAEIKELLKSLKKE